MATPGHEVWGLGALGLGFRVSGFGITWTLNHLIEGKHNKPPKQQRQQRTKLTTVWRRPEP